jgi:hypothetical protein
MQRLFGSGHRTLTYLLFFAMLAIYFLMQIVF